MILELAIKLLAAHAVCDYPLQGDYLAKTKSPWISGNGLVWIHSLTAHAMIHAGAVLMVTGSVALALAEFVLHWLIDLGKCAGKYGYHTDQAMHIACKLLWFAIATEVI